MSARLTASIGDRHMRVTPAAEPVTLRRVTGSGKAHLAAVAAMHRASVTAAVARIDAAHEAAKAAEFTVAGLCRACGSVEVLLLQADGTRDLSSIGESATYPTGYGCEMCA